MTTNLPDTVQNNPPAVQTWYRDVPRSGRTPTFAGYAILLIGVFGFTGWASTAPIEGAIVAPGVFVATSQNKVVQHLEGGIIREILVREGQPVSQGQALLRLDDTQANADLKRLILRKAQLQATATRLEAEAAQKTTLQFPDNLRNAGSNPDIEAILDAQQSIFVARRNRLLADIAILEKTVESFQRRAQGIRSRLDSAQTQHKLVSEELVGKAKLYRAGLVRKPEYFALRRADAKFTGEIGNLRSQIEDIGKRIAGANQEIDRARKTSIQEATERRQDISSELKDIRERITAQRSILSRIVVNAPVNGVVVKLNYHTPGGVIRPGNDILALLPLGDELVIEARIRPQDIDNLKNGQKALLRLTALSQRVTPMIPGEVIYVSADALPNERKLNDDNVYIVRVKLDTTEAAAVEHFLPTPGMPAEVYIKTGGRTFFQYLMAPVMDTMTRAFRES